MFRAQEIPFPARGRQAKVKHAGTYLAVVAYRLLGGWLPEVLVGGAGSYSERTGSEPNCNAPNCKLSPEISAEPGISTARAGI